MDIPLKWIAFLFILSTVIKASYQQFSGLPSCDGVPKSEGNFSFAVKKWSSIYRTAFKYDTLTLNCTTNRKDASVTLSYISTGQWTNVKDSKDIFPNFSQVDQVFSVLDASQAHSVFFRCTAKLKDRNICLVLGSYYVSSSPRNIDIEIIPTTRPITAVEGGVLQFYCTADGIGSRDASYLKWYKQKPSGQVELNRTLVQGQGYSQGGRTFDKEMVHIKNVKKSDAGTYTCKRDHSPTGTIQSKSVEVVIEDPTKPFVKLIPSAREVKVLEKKQRVKVVCSYLSGLPRPIMKWKDPQGKVIHECDEYNTNCTLEIISPEYSKNNGRYTCQASNKAGDFNIDVKVSVLVPVVLQKPWKQDVASFKDEVELSCASSKGNPLPKIVWYSQPWSCTTSVCAPDDQLWTKTFSKLSQKPDANTATNSSILTLPASKSSAFYSCHADNGAGVDSYNLTLHRIEKVQVTFKVSNTKSEKNMNDSFMLSCTGSSNIYKNLKWFKNGLELKEDLPRLRLSTVTNANFERVRTINFKRLVMTDAANYTCFATKRRGGVDQRDSILVVKALIAPVISNFADLALNQATDRALITCDVTGNPLPVVSWKFKNEKLDLTKSLLSLKDCSSRTSGVYLVGGNPQRNRIAICQLNYKIHQGEYTCIAKNKVSRTKKRINVVIHAKPTILKWPLEVNTKTGEMAYLVCEAEGNPHPNVTLLKMRENNASVQLDGMKQYGNGTAYAFVKVTEETVGKYICLAKNAYGQESKISNLKTQEFSTSILEKSVSATVIVVIVVCIVIFVIIVVAVACWHKKKIEKKFAPYLSPNANFQLDPDRSLFEQSGELPYDPDWEFPRERLSFLKMIGSGAFGEVWLAEAQGILILDPRDKTSNASKRRSKIRRSHRYTHMNGKDRNKSAARNDVSVEKTMVAVKTLKGDASDSDYKDLASELKILIHIGENKHIVNLLGACTRAGKLCVILEYCPHGSLLSFMRERRDIFEPTWFKQESDMGSEITYIDLTMVGYQVAKGMDFLASKKCVHRDVAARNVLVGVDYIVKIADFGLARDIYKDDCYMKQTSGLLPVKWMAPESLFDKLYTSQSDVWSFGIVLWEIFTLGGSPYPGLPTEDLFSFLEQGRRMEQSELCPLEMYAIMRDCWERYPNDRPLFSQIVDRIGQIISNHAGHENSYLRFDKEDGLMEATDSDYLLPVDKRTEEEKMRDSQINRMSSDVGYGAGATAAPSYQNTDEVRLKLLSEDNEFSDYANAKPRSYSDEREAIV